MKLLQAARRSSSTLWTVHLVLLRKGYSLLYKDSDWTPTIWNLSVRNFNSTRMPLASLISWIRYEYCRKALRLK